MLLYESPLEEHLVIFFYKYKVLTRKAWFLIGLSFAVFSPVLFKVNFRERILLVSIYGLLWLVRYGLYEFYLGAKYHNSIIRSIDKDSQTGHLRIETFPSDFLGIAFESKVYEWKSVYIFWDGSNFLSPRRVAPVEKDDVALGKVIRLTSIDKDLFIVYDEATSSEEIIELIKKIS